MSKSKKFRQLLLQDELALMMEAYNGVSAKIVEEVGFQCIWASGFSMSTSMGFRDYNELTATQILAIVEYIVGATSLPVLFDGDTGYGDFNDVRHLVRKLCQIGVVGLTIEDMKRKPNFCTDTKTPADLEPIDDFCMKIRAAKDVQTDPDFTVVGRVHALVCNAGLNEAIERAHAYQEAGADAIFVHSSQATADQVISFAETWHQKNKMTTPLIVCPVYYYKASLKELQRAKIAMVILATYNMRASIKAMRDISQKILAGESLQSIEEQIPSLKEVLELVDTAELAIAEQRYKTKKE